MPRDEHDREDLLAEAVALVERVELALAPRGERVFCGFRSIGCASFYFGGDPAYHFNTAGELRRAFVAGQLIRADDRTLVRLERRRTADATQLAAQALTAGEQATFLADAARRLAELRVALETAAYQTIGEVPAGAGVGARVCRWLQEHAGGIRVARIPHVR